MGSCNGRAKRDVGIEHSDKDEKVSDTGLIARAFMFSDSGSHDFRVRGTFC